MNEPIRHQIIKHQGEPVFVLVPYGEYQDLMRLKDIGPTIPQGVVEAHILEGKSMARAWREHLGLSQKEVADRLGVSQAALSQIEDPANKPRLATLKRLVNVLGLESIDQLT